MVKMIRQTLTRFQVLLALFSGIVGAVIASVPAYWQLSIMNSSLEAQREQINVMQQALEKEVHLIMTVVPSYRITVTPLPNSTVQERYSNLTLSRTTNFTFTIYVSNVGNAFAHILYYSISLNLDSTPTYEEIQIPLIKTTVLKPNESTIFEYIFDPLHIPSEILSTTNHINFTFGVGSAETTIYKVVPTEIS